MDLEAKKSALRSMPHGLYVVTLRRGEERCGAERLGDCLPALDAVVGDHHPTALAREQTSGRLPQSAGTTGDDRDPSIEPHLRHQRSLIDPGMTPGTMGDLLA